MKVIVTAGPTREPIDSVRFITNASSGKMGVACAAAAAAAGHEVTLVAGPVALDPPAGVEVVRFVSVSELAAAVEKRFAGCDALIMAAAVGDFTVAERAAGKLPRAGGPVRITLVPTEDILAGLGARKGPGQVLVGFAVEDVPPSARAADEAPPEGAPDPLAKAHAELTAKGCDYLVLNAPAAMGADASEACILSADGLVLEWARRSKKALAREIVNLLPGHLAQGTE